MKFEFTQEQLNNLMVFLDRAEMKGLKELQAMNEIINVLGNPIQEEAVSVEEPIEK